MMDMIMTNHQDCRAWNCKTRKKCFSRLNILSRFRFTIASPKLVTPTIRLYARPLKCTSTQLQGCSSFAIPAAHRILFQTQPLGFPHILRCNVTQNVVQKNCAPHCYVVYFQTIFFSCPAISCPAFSVNPNIAVLVQWPSHHYSSYWGHTHASIRTHWQTIGHHRQSTGDKFSAGYPSIKMISLHTPLPLCRPVGHHYTIIRQLSNDKQRHRKH